MTNMVSALPGKPSARAVSGIPPTVSHQASKLPSCLTLFVVGCPRGNQYSAMVSRPRSTPPMVRHPGSKACVPEACPPERLRLLGVKSYPVTPPLHITATRVLLPVAIHAHLTGRPIRSKVPEYPVRNRGCR